MAAELEDLEQAIDLCLLHLADQQRALDAPGGSQDRAATERLLAVHRDLLERQLRRRDELLAALESGAACEPPAPVVPPPRTEG